MTSWPGGCWVSGFGSTVEVIGPAGLLRYPTGSGPIELELALDPHVIISLIERLLSTDQHLTEDSDGRMHLTATLPEIDELTWWRLGFGFR